MNSSEPGVDLGSALTSLTYVRCPMGTLLLRALPGFIALRLSIVPGICAAHVESDTSKVLIDNGLHPLAKAIHTTAEHL